MVNMDFPSQCFPWFFVLVFKDIAILPHLFSLALVHHTRNPWTLPSFAKYSARHDILAHEKEATRQILTQLFAILICPVFPMFWFASDCLEGWTGVFKRGWLSVQLSFLLVLTRARVFLCIVSLQIYYGYGQIQK